MNSKKMWLILALVVVFIMATPTFSREIPGTNRRAVYDLDEHPWGGDLMADHGDFPGGGFSGSFIGSPLSIIDFFHMMFFTRTRADLPLIRGSAIQSNDNSTSTNSSPSTSAFFPGESQRGN